MSTRPNTTLLTLAELLRRGPLSGAEVVHLPKGNRQVGSVVLAQLLERLRKAEPHAVVILDGQAASGGWAVAAALHHAWERNASAVVTPRSAITTSTTSSSVLAERLGIALLVTDDNSVELALSLAAEVAAPMANRSLQLAQCAQRLAEQTSIRGILGVLNSELSPVQVALTMRGAVTAGRAGAMRNAPGVSTVTVDIPGASGKPWGHLVASVPADFDPRSGQVQALLALAQPSLLAAWARARMDASSRTVREQAAFGVLRALAARTAVTGASVETAEVEVEPPDWSSELGWRVAGANTAIWLTVGSSPGTAPSAELTELVRAAWLERLPDWPLVAQKDGWLSWQNTPVSAARGDLPATDNNAAADDPDRPAVRRALTRFLPSAASHDLVLGVGNRHDGVTGLMRSVQEARLAAQVAAGGAPGAVEYFAHVGPRATLAWLPRTQITQIAELALPDLMSTRDRDALVETALAVMDCGGSLSHASQMLGVHRNTVLSRITRIRELGVTFEDPAQRLALHMMCRVLATKTARVLDLPVTADPG